MKCYQLEFDFMLLHGLWMAWNPNLFGCTSLYSGDEERLITNVSHLDSQLRLKCAVPHVTKLVEHQRNQGRGRRGS